jgi:hypothetical protein
MRRALLFGSLLLVGSSALPQTTTDDSYVKPPTKPERPPDLTTVHVGPGVGSEYGFVGIHLSFLLDPRFRVFGGAGFAISGFGYSVGGQYRFLPKAKWCPYASAMYGFTDFIYVQNGEEFNKVYNGPSIGTGIELHKRYSGTFWRFGFTIPIRPPNYYEDMNAIMANPNIQGSENADQRPLYWIAAGIHWAI